MLIRRTDTVDDAFILYLFQHIEELSDDASDPYHHTIIRILVSSGSLAPAFALLTTLLARAQRAIYVFRADSRV